MDPSTSHAKTVKCVVVGDGAVGKTCLLVCYTEDKFPNEYVPTVFDTYAATIMCDQREVNLQLWDTAGQEEYDRLRVLSYNNTDVLCVCFSVISKASYSNVKERWLPELKHHCAGTPLVLVATKIDLRNDKEMIQQLSQKGLKPLTENEGKKLAKEIGAAAYIETSAREMLNVTQLFDTAVRTALKAQEPPEVKRGCCIL